MNPEWLERTDTELAYFAGIIDGEGCFVLHDSGKHIFACQLHVGNTDPRLLEWIQVRFGGKISFEARRKSPTHKPVWRWTSHTENLGAIIAAVLPYLVIKRDRAELLLAYRRTLDLTSRKEGTSPAIKTERRAIHTRLALLNKRGA